jgi:NAD(P)-dependent dehydrogenase (short-subunit alcohol dehydrogenase family)
VPSFESRRLSGQVAIVTGASGGIGRAISHALAREGARIYALGRNPERLKKAAAESVMSSDIVNLAVDLTSEQQVDEVAHKLATVAKVSILIHCAGMLCQSTMKNASIERLDAQYAVNLRAPYLLTTRLLPLLEASQGQIVFINSTTGLNAKRPEIGQYAATKHALRAVADSLREEVNPKGVRVTSVYLGRTAGPLQERLHREEGKRYEPESLVQPEDVASVVLESLVLSRTAEITDITMRPLRKAR